MQQAPEAAVDDELMDLTIIKKMSKLRIIRNFRMLYTGNIYTNPKVLHQQCKKIEIESWPQSRIEIDGEAVGTSPFVFELVPHAIRVVVGVSYSGSTSSTIA